MTAKQSRPDVNTARLWRLAWECLKLWFMRVIPSFLTNWLTRPIQQAVCKRWLNHRRPRVLHAIDPWYHRTIHMPILLWTRQCVIVDKPFDCNIDNGYPPARRSDASNRVGREPTRPTVESMLQRALPRHYLRNCHQLDYATSGIYVVALTKQFASRASQLWRQRWVRKTYLAVVWGHTRSTLVTESKQAWVEPFPSPVNITDTNTDTNTCACDHGFGWTVRVSVGEDPDRDRCMKAEGRHAKSAETAVHVLGYFTFENQPVTLVRVHPKTGRRHQIRIHLHWLGHAIVGDPLYQHATAPKVEAYRMMLHAARLELPFHRLPAIDGQSSEPQPPRPRPNSTTTCAEWLHHQLCHLMQHGRHLLISGMQSHVQFQVEHVVVESAWPCFIDTLEPRPTRAWLTRHLSEPPQLSD